MKELLEATKALIGDILQRLAALEEGAKVSLFGPRRDISVKADEPIFIRESADLGVRQQFRLNHGDGIFLHDHVGRGRFFHSVSVASGSDHVHMPSARYEQEGSPHFGFGYSGQLRVRKTDDGEELLLVKYVASGAATDWLHPDLAKPDENIRILEVITLARNGRWVLDDTDQRRVLNG